MNKIFAVLLAFVLCFAGCSEEPEEVITEEPSAIVVEPVNKYLTAVVYDRGEDEEYWNDIKNAFESANRDVTITLILTKDAGYEVRERILGGNSPDFVFLPSDEESGVTEALVKDKAMIALTDVEESAPAGIFENKVCKPYEDGVSYLTPIFTESKGLIYNKDLLANNGFSVPTTWDEFVSIAEGCKNKNFAFFTYAGAEPDEFVDIFAAALVPEIGAEEMNKLLSCDEEAWKNEAVTKFAEKIESVIKLVVSGSSTKTKDDVKSALKDGKALFISGTEEDLEELNKDGEKYAICKYPALSGSQIETVSFSEMYIPIEAKEPELAMDFMKFVYSEMESSGSAYAPAFEVKTAANATLSDEFCGLVVDIFKSNADSEDFAEKMIEYIKEY
ncbi:MAG: extracellular solute-binding protein [Oscillospiraceae bacterium]|nr:extracellular solute-binding protein [Oscillospiraceae bacterium]